MQVETFSHGQPERAKQHADVSERKKKLGAGERLPRVALSLPHGEARS
jgi:hypothetical protein